MTLRERVTAQLKQDEGRRTRPYQDTVGVWSVGYGHNLTTTPLSEDALTQILHDDVLTAETACLALPIWPRLSEARQGVLLNMCFNLGVTGLLRFTHFYAAMEAEDWNGAAAAMLDSHWARQVGARATRLARQMREGTWA